MVKRMCIFTAKNCFHSKMGKYKGKHRRQKIFKSYSKRKRVLSQGEKIIKIEENTTFGFRFFFVFFIKYHFYLL